MTKVLLYSGGMDSWLIDKLWHPDVKLYVNIHGRYSASEIKRLPEDVKIVPFPFLGEQEQDDAYVPMRNLYFLMLASHFGDTVCLGATAGDGGADKSMGFLKEADALLGKLWADKKVRKSVHVETRFAKMSKSELIGAYIAQGGSLKRIQDETFSCYTPVNGHECFNCYPCFRKFAVLYDAGAEYPREVRERMWEYVRKHIIPTAAEGGYDGTYYTDRGEESEHLIRTVEALRGEFA